MTNPGGRPSDYTDDIAREICERLADGHSLREICGKFNGFAMRPCRQTILRWIGENPKFRDQYARAREAQADAMDEMILETAKASTPESCHADRVKIDAFKWRAGKLKPKVYGDKVEQTQIHEAGDSLLEFMRKQRGNAG